MADDDAEKKSGGESNLLLELPLFLLGIFVAVAFVGELLRRIGGFLSGDNSGGVSGVYGLTRLPYIGPVVDLIFFTLPFVQILAIIVSAVMVMVIINVLRKKNDLLEEVTNKVYPVGYHNQAESMLDPIISQFDKSDSDRHDQNETDKENHSNIASRVNPRWQKIEDSLESENPNDWRQAIIEADVMLDNLLTRTGYPGQSVGDKLKEVERSDFQTIDDAWEAHKFRNQIAHAGSDLLLSKHEARRIIGLFKNVFNEFEVL